MSGKTDPEQQVPEQKTTGADWIIPILAICFAIYYTASVAELRWEAKMSGVVVAVALGLLIAIFAGRVALGLIRGTHRFTMSGLFDSRQGAGRQFIMLGLIVGFIVAIQSIGFTLSVFGFLIMAFIFIARLRLIRSLSLAAIFAISSYLLFIVALQTRFPRGPFEQLMSAIHGQWF